jgi:hypothetical protein
MVDELIIFLFRSYYNSKELNYTIIYSETLEFNGYQNEIESNRKLGKIPAE